MFINYVEYYATKWHTLKYAPRLQNPSICQVDAKTDLTDQALCLAVSEMVGGLVDADLGGDVLKKRVALPGRGKRGGARTLVATRRASRWFFVFGFEKNEKANVSRTELEALQWLAKQLLDLTGRQLEVAVQDGSLQEICHEH